MRSWHLVPARRLCRAACLVSALVLTGCSSAPPPSIVNALRTDATIDDFRYCGGYGCKEPHRVAFAPEQWSQVVQLFDPPPQTAAAERAAMAHSVGLLEAFAGAQTGTDQDRGGTMFNLFSPGQIDCYSEAANTTNFLMLLDRHNLLRHHVGGT